MNDREGSVVIIGNFDGYHLGHAKIVSGAKLIADKNNLKTVLITFEPNPKIFFGREKTLIFNCSKKIEYLKKAGLNKIECLNFIKIKDMAASDFIDNILIKIYRMKFLVVGKNFRLGRKQEWDVNNLISYGKERGFGVEVTDPVYFQGESISSTRIRNLLRNGEVEVANKMLGRDYSVSGIVIKGEKIGTKIGFPTINIPDENSILPYGVYSSLTEISGRFYKSATYIGTNPTFRKKTSRIESHIIGFNRKIYGEYVKINFKKLIRREIKFTSKKALIDQIEMDIESIKLDN